MAFVQQHGARRNLSSTAGFLLLSLLAAIFPISPENLAVVSWDEAKSSASPSRCEEDSHCSYTCRKLLRLEIVETIPDSLQFEGHIPRSTFDAWQGLIQLAKWQIDIAAYKSSLRAKHVLGEIKLPGGQLGEVIFADLLSAGREKGISIRMVENFPPKDEGDNVDGASLARRGALERRPLHYSKINGAGTMHSKFFVVDRAHFYLGSANLDWRSLNQKMELGVVVLDCPCLAEDMDTVFASYWALTEKKNRTTAVEFDTSERVKLRPVAAAAVHNQQNPLVVRYKGVPAELYLATSPRELNGPGRTWDLKAILTAIEGAQKFLYIHVMDYIPMVAYKNPQRYWPVIDEAIRRAVIDRGVEVKLLAAALHFVPQTLRFLNSLSSISGVHPIGTMEVKIFKVPAMTELQASIARERRTHNKFLVTESTAIIGTSNWSGDYFLSSTGVALVVSQNGTLKRPFVKEMRDIFLRDWSSSYAHSLNTYLQLCLSGKEEHELCEVDKENSHLKPATEF